MTTDMNELTQLRAIKDLTKQLPLNDMGLPVGIYRPDLLPWHTYEAPHLMLPEHLQPEAVDSQTVPAVPEIRQAHLDTIDDLGFDMPVMELDNDVVTAVDLAQEDGDRTEKALITSHFEPAPEIAVPPSPTIRRIAGFVQSDLDIAFVWLHFDDGFPALESGEPFWGRFIFEPHDAYTAFQEYLQMPLGTPTGWDEDEEESVGSSATGVRAIGDLAATLHGNGDLLQKQEQYRSYSIMYYWGLRAQAYDMYRVVQHQQRQEQRAIETLDEHYITARKLRGRLDTYMDNEEFWEMLTPKVAIDLLKTTTGLERMSVGMGAAGPGVSGSQEGGGQTMEVAYRTIAQNNNTKGDGEGNLIEASSGEVLSEMLGDPEQAGMLQELIIKVGGG